ncbi:probable low affinity copper uptake protein 2 isoform X2 [Neomonachus schauinslandi]|uniref:Copper transport protein n=1 Tax=Neomonachus schauinslandi TaxID=29088 RepID=A0A2Y9HCZ8_NEOSC|nr:probable low affinity copper uptake protein 2 isoform X2 [Neomonachus schauinslandi]
MHFIFSNEVVLLFDFWSVHSSAGMALSVLVVLLLAVLYESIKVGKAKLLYQATVGMSIPTSQLTEETDQDSSSSDSPPVSRIRLSSWRRPAEASTCCPEFGGPCSYLCPQPACTGPGHELFVP